MNYYIELIASDVYCHAVHTVTESVLNESDNTITLTGRDGTRFVIADPGEKDNTGQTLALWSTFDVNGDNLTERGGHLDMLQHDLWERVDGIDPEGE